MMILEGECTIHTASEQYDLLRSALAGGETEFDLAGITEFDSAGLQLMIALARSPDANGGAPAFLRPSEAVRATLLLFGLNERFNPDEGAHG